MKEHNKMLGVWISISCFGSTPLRRFVGLGVQASKETARKLKFSKLLSLRWCLWWIFIATFCAWWGMKAELNYFSSLALNIFLRFHAVLTFIAFSFSCITSTARWVFKHYFLMVSLSHNKRWDLQLFLYFWESAEYLCFFFITHIYTNIFYKKLVLNSLPDYNRNIIPDDIRNTMAYCFHNNTEQKKN